MKFKKITVLLLVIIFSLTFLFIQRFMHNGVSAKKIDTVVVAKIRFGSGKDELGVSGPFQKMFYNEPGTFAVENSSDIYITDQVKKRIVEVRNGSIVKEISIESLFGKNATISPKQLFITHSCIYLLFAKPSNINYSYFIAIIKNGKIVKVINLNDYYKKYYVVAFTASRLLNDKLVIVPDSPQKNVKPVALIIEPSGSVKVVYKMVDGSFDGITPYCDIITSKNNISVEIHNPITDKTHTVNVKTNGNIATVPLQCLNPEIGKGALHYFTTKGESNGVMVSYVLYFNYKLKNVKQCVMEVNKEKFKDFLPPSFDIGETEVLGSDGFLYDMNYTKQGCIIERLEERSRN